MADKVEENETKFHGDMFGGEIPFTASVTFDELDEENNSKRMSAELAKLSNQSQALTSSVISNPEIENKPLAIMEIANGFIERVQRVSVNKSQPLTDFVANKVADVNKAEFKTEGGIKFPASDFAFTPDKEKPSTWKLRLAQDKPGNITRSQLGAAAAALSPGGFRGNRVKLPSEAVSGVKSRIRKEYKKLGIKPDDIPASVKQQASVNIWKSESGRYHWLTLYSNAYRDVDNPPEIISHQSHIDNNKAINDGSWSMPELWLWHIPYPVGKATYHNYNEKSRFAVAAGMFDSNKGHIAEALIKSEWDGVSHGMPKNEIKRDDDDKTILTRHRTKEISILPLNKAANRLTFNIIGGTKMQMKDDVKNALETLLGSDEVANIEAALSDTKEVETEQVQKVEVVKPEPEPDEDVQDGELPLTRTEVVEALKAVIEPLQSEIQTLKSQLAKKQDPEPAPGNELLKLLQATSVIGKEAARVDGRTTLAKEKPMEPKADRSPGLLGLFDEMVEQNKAVVQ